MSNLKKRLNKTADSTGIQTSIYLLIEKELTNKAREIGWTGDIEEAAVIVDSNLGSYSTEVIAQAISVAIELWAEENQKI